MVKKRRKKSKIYFGKPTEDAVLDYLQAETLAEKHKIFNERMYKPFAKLIENIVFTYRFINLDDSVEDLQKECLSHVYMNLHKFKPGKGRAFSYFGTMTKNYLIQKTIKKKKSNNNIYMIDEMSENWVENLGVDKQIAKDRTDEINKDLIELVIFHLDQNLVNVKNHNEKKVVQAILYLLEHREDIDLFNKKQLYVLLREITDLPTKKITQALNKIKQTYYKLKSSYLTTGSV